MEKQTLHFWRSYRKWEDREGITNFWGHFGKPSTMSCWRGWKEGIHSKTYEKLLPCLGVHSQTSGVVSRAKSWEEELDIQEKRVSPVWKLLDISAAICYHIGQQNGHERPRAAVSLLHPKFHMSSSFDQVYLGSTHSVTLGNVTPSLTKVTQHKPQWSTLHPGIHIHAL